MVKIVLFSEMLDASLSLSSFSSAVYIMNQSPVSARELSATEWKTSTYGRIKYRNKNNLPLDHHVASINHSGFLEEIACYLYGMSSQDSWPLIRRPRVSSGHVFSTCWRPAKYMVEGWCTAPWEEKQEMQEDLVPALAEINGSAKPSQGSWISSSSFLILYSLLSPSLSCVLILC